MHSHFLHAVFIQSSAEKRTEGGPRRREKPRSIGSTLFAECLLRKSTPEFKRGLSKRKNIFIVKTAL